MSLTESQLTIEELLMTQHRAWAPEYVRFSDTYIVWGGGRLNMIRIHYRDVEEVKLLSWRRKSRQWYVVRVLQQEHKGAINVLRTKDLDDAKRFADAFVSLLSEYEKRDQSPIHN